MKQTIHSGTQDPSVASWEIRHREVARRAAAEGMVLLKNESLLPFRSGEAIALLGGGAGHTIKGGTGSGDVNERETVSVEAGLKEAGVFLTSESWLRDFDKRYEEARLAWKQEILSAGSDHSSVFYHYASHPFRMPAGRPLAFGDVKGAAAAVYVISRVAGEGADRQLERGDYYLSERELADLKWLDSQEVPIVVLLNTGAPVDMQEVLALEWVRAVLLISQPGQEGGHAVADILLGKVSPSGKLTDTWAACFEDYPNAETFSSLSGDVEKEYYREGIYVGYRYFDSFGKKPLYPFGFGLSYTRFLITPRGVLPHANGLTVSFRVINTGDLPGREVVQLYAACPQEGLPKEAQRLVAFVKTPLLPPGDSWEGTLEVPSKNLASYDEARASWILEKGRYGLWIGNSSRQTRPCGTAVVEKDMVLEEDVPICPQQDWLLEIVRPEQARELLREREQELKAAGVPEVIFAPKPEEHPIPFGDEISREARRLASRIPAEELIPLLFGEHSLHNGVIGDSGIQVPGSAAETTRSLWEEYGIVPVVLADGPAGLRLKKRYVIDRISGSVVDEGPLTNMEGGFFAKEAPSSMGTVWYQFATAFPIGTLLAQSFDTELLEEVGRTVAEEMETFHVSWWLAPGMNIHRNPLCGRNFEYYSEDPLVSGRMAAAITRGVQSLPGTGTTIKHFACNNQEDNRFGSDSVVSERALREIYLRGFEIAVKTSQPMCIMTSYNLVNDVHAANSWDLCTQAARREWGFQGLIMTDWGTTTPDRGSTPRGCIAAGNDLIMPGSSRDEEDLRQALAEGALTEEQIRECAARILDIILRTNAYEDAVPYPKLRK